MSWFRSNYCSRSRERSPGARSGAHRGHIDGENRLTEMRQPRNENHGDMELTAVNGEWNRRQACLDEDDREQRRHHERSHCAHHSYSLHMWGHRTTVKRDCKATIDLSNCSGYVRPLELT
jgi:hypothetical protein